MKEHPEFFRTLKTKAVVRVCVSAADVEEVKDWFQGFRTWCKERDIQLGDVLNFDEVGFRVGVALGKEIVVPAYVKEVCTKSKAYKKYPNVLVIYCNL